MVSRILSFTLAAAWAATATPSLAWDNSDPSGPPPDDPAAYTTSGRAPARVSRELKHCDMMFADIPSSVESDDPSAYRIERGVTCSCHARALPMGHASKGGSSG